MRRLAIVRSPLALGARDPGSPLAPLMRSRVRSTIVVLAALFAMACGQGTPKFMASDVTGTKFGRDFELIDHNGKPRTLADYRGKAVVMFFGYTQCPDFCPTTLSELAETMKRLGADADRVQVLFVTVDPDRDTPELLSKYVPAFDPRFVGLYGDADATARTAKEFKVIYQKQPGQTPGTYTVDHSAGTFIFDPAGKLRVYVGYGQGPDVFVHDIRELLRTSSS
jgi:protein SCO1